MLNYLKLFGFLRYFKLFRSENFKKLFLKKTLRKSHLSVAAHNPAITQPLGSEVIAITQPSQRWGQKSI